MSDWNVLGLVLVVGVLGLAASRVLLQRWLDNSKTKVNDDNDGFWVRPRRG